MSYRTILTSILALICLAVPAAASAAGSAGAVVFSKATTDSAGVVKGGLYAVKDGHLNQLTENPGDVEPEFSADGRTIAFARAGDLFTIRPDGSGERRLSSGAEVDSRPQISPNGRLVVFERRATEGAAADLYTVSINGGAAHPLTSGSEDDTQATFSPDGNTIVFVRASTSGAGAINDDLYSVRPAGTGLARLTRTGAVDEFAPRYFAGGILFSRGNVSEGPAGYADVYTMKRDGSRIKPQIAGVGSAYVEDVSPDGHTVLFRRDQGLWIKHIGNGKARKLTQLPDGSVTNSVFSSDGRRVAAFVAAEDEEHLVALNARNGSLTELASGFDATSEAGTVLGPVIAWQP